MKSFQYVAPETIQEAVALLGDQWGQSEVLAGGTDLITCLKQGIEEAERLVSLKHITALKRIKVHRKEVEIGSMVTLKELAAHPVIQDHFPALATAIQGIGSPQIMAMGTVGGDLCQRPRCWFYRNGMGRFGVKNGVSLVESGDNRYHAIFGNDGPALFVSPSSLGPAFQVLGASVNLVGAGDQSRKLAVTDFFRTPRQENERETVLKPNEILESIVLPLSGLKNATYEIRHRAGLDWPFVTASVAFDHQGGKASNGSIVLGHVAPRPWQAVHASNLLNGSALNEALAERCAEEAVRGARPLSRNAYKVHMVRTAVKRAVLSAAQS